MTIRLRSWAVWKFGDPLGVCRCSHTKAVHKHYRKGNDCGVCACSNYRRAL